MISLCYSIADCLAQKCRCCAACDTVLFTIYSEESASFAQRVARYCPTFSTENTQVLRSVWHGTVHLPAQTTCAQRVTQYCPPLSAENIGSAQHVAHNAHRSSWGCVSVDEAWRAPSWNTCTENIVFAQRVLQYYRLLRTKMCVQRSV